MTTFEEAFKLLGRAIDERLGNSSCTPVLGTDIVDTLVPEVIVPIPPIEAPVGVDYALPNLGLVTKNSFVKKVTQVAYITPVTKSYKIFLVEFDNGKRTYRVDENGILSCGKNIFDNPKVTILPGFNKETLKASVLDSITKFDGLEEDPYAAKL